MGALGLKHASVAAAVAACTACSIWAAIDDPYKGEAEGTTPGDSGAPPADGAASGGRVVDAGFVPYAIAALGDTVYAVDDMGQVHVAYDAGTSFTSFWQGEGGAFLQANGIAASDAGVFWSTSNAIHYCGIDGGACGEMRLAPNSAPRAIAASDMAVAWVDVGQTNKGVNTCPLPLGQCIPTTLPLAMNAAVSSIAVGPNGTVAWAEGGMYIRLSSRLGNPVGVVYPVTLVATDFASGRLYWAGPSAVGSMQFDGTESAFYPEDLPARPSQLFASHGTIYWSFANMQPTVVRYCAFETDGGGCTPRELSAPVSGPTSNSGIIANSREVLTIVSSTASYFPFPEMVVWRLP